ncbi:cytochrome c550 [Virgibacillus necropolis]|uniref:Cytochrome C n=1 Tax=Virgibacillus necropolis TaxID=163877 RepID=A0A221MC49_9BACI|nr:cytochrome c [Virgibacillus necropolis]ASN05207.1 cytochrome C [Virgibacillus necropolis]
MKRNPVIPFAIIAIIGILMVIVLSVVGLGQQEAIEKAEEGGGEKQEQGEGATTDDPEAIFQNTCVSCHGADLTGGVGPDLTQVGSRYSKEEIKDIIINGKGTMPAGLVQEPQAEALAKWLAEKK